MVLYLLPSFFFIMLSAFAADDCPPAKKDLSVESALKWSCEKGQPQKLKDLFQKHGLFFGSAVNDRSLRDSNDPGYQQLLLDQFGSLTPENEMKFGQTEPTQGTFNYQKADDLVQFAHDHKMKVRAHTLAWQSHLPDWVLKGNFTGQQLKEILHRHIVDEVTHFHTKFPDMVFDWDVVNEAVDGKTGQVRDPSQDVWSKIGVSKEEYIKLAFQWAHEADPTARLFYNDYGAEMKNGKSDGVFRLLMSLKKSGVPIDGVGFQAHLDENVKVDFKSIQDNFARFSDAGFKISITEADYGLAEANEPEDCKPTETQVNKQADFMAQLLDVCLKTKNCISFSTWGVSDNHSWLTKRRPELNAPTLFDSQYQPKPAFCAMVKLL